MKAPNIDKLISDVHRQLEDKLTLNAIKNPIIIGIHTGGYWIAQALHQRLLSTEPLGSLDISFYRDDFTRIGINPQVRPSQLPDSIDGKNIILVDDILHTGRTIRAALNEIFDFGRPASITLCVLAERPGRELPIQADIVGAHLDIAPCEHIKLTGPSPLTFEIQSNESKSR